MNREEFDYVQSSICYTFKNERLLHQAFTRKSYSAEHPEVQDNEVLEFYGDEVLDFYVAKMMCKRFSKLKNGELVSEKNESELTKLKSIVVGKGSLANCVWKLGFSKFLYLGNSDIKNEVWKTASVNEDLFESILGAVAIDSDWSFAELEKVCRAMLKGETENSYLVSLVQEKSLALGFGEPLLRPNCWQAENPADIQQFNLWEMRIGAPHEFASSKNPKTGLCEFIVEIGKYGFLGVGNNVNQAFLDAHKKAYHFLCQEEIKRNFSHLDYDNSVSSLHELLQKKMIMEPRYEFNEYHDENGNPIWNCKVFLEGYGCFEANDVSKKHVKQIAAKKLLNYIATEKIENSAKWETPVFYLGEARFWSDEEKAAQQKRYDNIFGKREGE